MTEMTEDCASGQVIHSIADVSSFGYRKARTNRYFVISALDASPFRTGLFHAVFG